MRIASVLVVIAAAAGSARADRARAAQLAAEAAAAHDPAKYVACGDAYQAAYAADPAAADAVDLLYNGAVCAESGGAAAAAIGRYEQVRRHPRSRLAARAHARLAVLRERLGELAEAAALYEDYARRYAGDRGAPDALTSAIALREALGDDAAVAADVQRYIAAYGRKRPADAARVVFAATAAAERRGPRAAVDHLRGYLKAHGARGGVELRIQALVRIGELRWRAACPIAPLDGLCARRAAAPGNPGRTPDAQHALRHRCGATGAGAYEVVPRVPAAVAEAVAAIGQAIRLSETHPPTDPVTRARLAAGRLVLADRELETYLAIRFPTGLDFTGRRAASVNRFQAFLARKRQLGAAAHARYEAVLAASKTDASAPTQVAATARIALISEAFAAALRAAEVPRDVQTGPHAADKLAAYCDALSEAAEPMRQTAIAAFERCRDQAAALGVSGAAPAACARAAARLAAPTEPIVDDRVPATPWPVDPIDAPAVSPRATHPAALVALLGDARALFAGPPPPAGRCVALARAFDALTARARLADAAYMAGWVDAACGRAADAAAAYRRALQLDPRHAAARANLGALAWRAGRRADARRDWQAALAIDPRLAAAHVDLAFAALADGGPAAEIARHAAAAAAVDDASALPSAARALAALAGPDAARASRRARYHVARALAIDASPPAVRLAAATVLARADDPSAVTWFTRAAERGAPGAGLALALHQLRLRRWSDAQRTLAALPRSYERAVAAGIAARALGQLGDAEARYAEAIAIDPARPEAHFDLGVLWRARAAAAAHDRAAARRALGKAAAAFRRAGDASARALADACDQAAAIP